MEEKEKFYKKHPFFAAVLLSVGLGAALALVLQIGMAGLYIMRGVSLDEIAELTGAVISGMFIYGGFMIFPLVLTGAEIYLLVRGRKNHALYKKG